MTRTVRKLVTFPELGARLLEEAAGPAVRRAAGDYIATVLQQRREDWQAAVGILERYLPRRALRDLLEAAAGARLRLTDRAEDLPAVAPILGDNLYRPHVELALRVLLAEWAARNDALRAALDRD